VEPERDQSALHDLLAEMAATHEQATLGERAISELLDEAIRPRPRLRLVVSGDGQTDAQESGP
jgi:hypothetical protein